MDALRVAKKRVRVRAEFTNHTTQVGDFYADLQRFDGTSATIVDRLNDPLEDYLPLARGERQHLLLNKSNLLTVSLGRSEIAPLHDEGATTLEAEFLLSTGVSVRGTIHAILPPAQARLLDYLNRVGHRFITLFVEDGVTLVNRDHVIGVIPDPLRTAHRTAPYELARPLVSDEGIGDLLQADDPLARDERKSWLGRADL